MNIVKTKELVFGSRRIKHAPKPTSIDNQEIEIIDSFKYHGIILDQRLTLVKCRICIHENSAYLSHGKL